MEREHLITRAIAGMDLSAAEVAFRSGRGEIRLRHNWMGVEDRRVIAAVRNAYRRLARIYIESGAEASIVVLTPGGQPLETVTATTLKQAGM